MLTSTSFRDWFRANMALYLKPIWLEIKAVLTQAKAYADDKLASDAVFTDGTATDKAPTVKQVKDALASVSVTGVFRGGFDTLAAFPSTAKNGDWGVLRVDDGTIESGIYVKGTGGWSFVMDISTLNEVQALIATDAEFSAGTATDKLVNVKQVASAIAVLASKGGRVLAGLNFGEFYNLSQTVETTRNWFPEIRPNDYVFVRNDTAGSTRLMRWTGAAWAQDGVFAHPGGTASAEYTVAPANSPTSAVRLDQIAQYSEDRLGYVIPPVTGGEADEDWAAVVAAN